MPRAGAMLSGAWWERGCGHTALGVGCPLRSTASSTASSGSQQRGRTRLECLVGGTCDSCWKNRRPPRGTEPSRGQQVRKSIPTCRRWTGVLGADLRGPGDAGWMPRGGRGRGKEPASPPPPQAFRSRPAGPGVEGQLCAAQEEGDWGVTLPSAWANIRPLSWDGRPVPLRGGCGGILFIGSARRRSAHRPFPGQRWVRMGRRDPVAPTRSWVTGAG